MVNDIQWLVFSLYKVHVKPPKYDSTITQNEDNFWNDSLTVVQLLNSTSKQDDIPNKIEFDIIFGIVIWEVWLYWNYQVILKCFIYICIGFFRSSLSTKMDSKQPKYIINRGIKRDLDAQMKTYKQEKCRLSFLYTKRRVLRDGISNCPLDL